MATDGRSLNRQATNILSSRQFSWQHPALPAHTNRMDRTVLEFQEYRPVGCRAVRRPAPPCEWPTCFLESREHALQPSYFRSQAAFATPLHHLVEEPRWRYVEAGS